MIILTKFNILRFLLAGLCSVFLLTLFLDYKGYKLEQFQLFDKQRQVFANKSKIFNGVPVKAPMIAFINRIDRNATVINESLTKDYELAEALHTVKFSQLGHSNVSIKNQKKKKKKTYTKKDLCVDLDIESDAFVGPIVPNVTVVSLDEVSQKVGKNLEPGGLFVPTNCKAKHHVAIVVPFRDRYAHLSIFLRNMHPFLMKQNIYYRIFIVEQTNGKAFNRASLMNVGYLEALKLYHWDCFIFHDIDLLPLDDRNVYNCPRQPRHMSVAIDTFHFRLPYRSIFGGVSAMRTDHFRLVNGFSNSFFGWGGEDDDMSNRIRSSNLFISRYPNNIARYTMMKHQKEKANPKRFENLMNGINKMELDGINSIQYDVYSLKNFSTFTWLLIELRMSPDHPKS